MYSSAVLSCLEPPLVVEDGETYDYVFEMLASLRPGTFPKFEADEIPGPYRFEWRLNTRYEPGDWAEAPLPEALRVSNTFRVTEK